MPKCVIKQCKNDKSKKKKEEGGVTFHRIPIRNKHLREKWVDFIRACRNEPSWEPTQHSLVCSTHFKNEDLYYTRNGFRRVLQNGYPKTLSIDKENSLLATTSQSSSNYTNMPAFSTQTFAIVEENLLAESQSSVTCINNLPASSTQTFAIVEEDLLAESQSSLYYINMPASSPQTFAIDEENLLAESQSPVTCINLPASFTQTFAIVEEDSLAESQSSLYYINMPAPSTQTFAIVEENLLAESQSSVTCINNLPASSTQRILTMAEKVKLLKVLHPHQISPMQNQMNIPPLQSRKNIYTTNVKRDMPQANGLSENLNYKIFSGNSKYTQHYLGQWKNQTQMREKNKQQEMVQNQDIEDLIQASVLVPGKQPEIRNTSKNPDWRPETIQKKTNLETEKLCLQLCSECNNTLTGFVYVCVRCAVRLCGACARRAAHARCYVLRAPGDSDESELGLVLDKIREALSMLPLQTCVPASSHVPDADSLPPEDSLPPDVGSLPPDEAEFEVIKMEVEPEEEQIQRPIDPLSTPAENQYLHLDSTRTSEGTVYPQQDDDASSSTISASNSSSEFSSTDSEEQNSSAPTKRKLNWTREMNTHLVRAYLIVSKTETNKSRIYSRLKQAFATVFPRIKVTKTQLREQRKRIMHKKLVTMADILNLTYERPDVDLTIDDEATEKTAKELSSKGVRLELAKVTTDQSRVGNKTARPMETPFKYPRVKPELVTDHYPKIVGVGQYDEVVTNNKTKTKPSRKYKLNQFINKKNLPPARSGRMRRVPDKFISGDFV